MNQKEIIELSKKYITAANELDNAGLTSEAAKIDEEILLAINEGLLPIKLKLEKIASNSKNVKLAIRGSSDWNDYLENMATGAGGAAGTTLSSGIGAPITGVAALAGAGLGAAGTLVGDWTFNHLQGQTSKMEALGNDLIQSANGLANTVANYDLNSAQQIQQLAESLNQYIAQIREQKRQEISQKVGLDPNQGFLQSINPMNWGKVLNRKWQMTTSDKKSDMIKTAAEAENFFIQPDFMGTGIAQSVKQGTGIGLKNFNPLTGGIEGLTGAQFLKGGLGGAVGAMGGRAGYNWLANKMRGPAGVLQKQISDVQKIGAALSQISQNPQLEAITQQIAMLAQGSLQAIQQGQQPQQQQPYQQTMPTGTNSTYR